MTRDYKPAARLRRPLSRGSGGSLLVGILIGLLLGLGIALAVALYLNRVPSPFLGRGKAPEPALPAKAEPGKGAKSTAAPRQDDAQAKAPEKSRFEFYKILPGTEETPSTREPKEAAVKPPAPPPVEAKEAFFLQAGAFQSAADADNLKARLALLGVEAAVQAATLADRGTMHRVRVGPFTRVDEVTRVRETLKQNGIETTLIRMRDG